MYTFFRFRDGNFLPIKVVVFVAFVAVLLLFTTASCVSSEDNIISSPYIVNRYIDEDAGVVCWVFDGYNKGGISCLPVKDTTIRVGVHEK